ncbi:MAG: primosome assembly protein PriA, partial [Propionibacteriaceae bacterium]|nr:primosome assembly protein PriA [Propionibacteriaceae bacterium]
METVLVAKVAVDTPLPHLDRPFDYLVPPGEEVPVGARVRVRFAGQLRSGYVLELAQIESRPGLLPLKLVSPEPVLSEPVARLCRAVADHYAGTLSDVLRLAIPPRHAAVENASPPEYPEPILGGEAEVLPSYPQGEAFLAAMAAGKHPRAVWTLAPTLGSLGEWAGGLLDAAEAALEHGQSALLLAADAKALKRLASEAQVRFGPGSFALLEAGLGPAARYRAFLAASRGQVRLVLGAQSAVYTPIPDLGFIGLFDDGDDSWQFERSPYPHARQVVALRAWQERAALLFA